MCPSDGELIKILGLIKKVLAILQIAIPIILLLFGTLDLGKAVMAGDEKEIKAATSTLLKRAVAAIAVFLLFMIVTLVTGWVGGKEWATCWANANKNVVISNTGI